MYARTLSLLLCLAMMPCAAAESLPLVERETRPNAPLTLDDLLTLAASANPALRAARAGADASEDAFMQAGMRPNPELSFLQEGFDASERTSTALLSQRIELGGKRAARLDVASYGRQAALASLDVRNATLRAQVVGAFYGLLAAQWQLRVATESADIAARSAELADKRVRAGKISPVEAGKANVALATARIELDRAKTGVVTQTARLATITGVPTLGDRAVTGDIETLPMPGSAAEIVARASDAPLARAAQAQMLRANAAISVERAKRVPDITLSAGMKHVVTGGAPINQAVIGVSIPLPIFDSNKGALLEAAHEAERAEAEFADEQANLRLALATAYANYRSAADEARRLKSDVLPAARDTLDATSRGFELGKFAVLDVLDAQRTLFQEQSRYAQALTVAHLAYAELGRLEGTLLPDYPTPTPTPLIAQP